MSKETLPITRSKVLIVGRMEIDVITNPFRKNFRTSGGSGVYAAFAASQLTETALASITGRNFPNETLRFLQLKVDTSGVKIDPNRMCNEWIGKYDNLDRAATKSYIENIPESNIDIPLELQRSPYVFIAAMHPSIQLNVLSQLPKPEVVMVDTIRGFVKREKSLVDRVFSKAEVITVNEEEATLFTGTNSNVQICLDQLINKGAKAAIIKRGSEGSIMSIDEFLFNLPSYNQNPLDTTGAGDAFGGAFISYLARQREIRSFLDTLAFGEALLMGSIMASFAIEDFGPNRFHTLTFEEVFSRFLTARTKLPLTDVIEINKKLNGNLLIDLFHHGPNISEESFQSLIPKDYFPGAYTLDEVENSLEFPDFKKCYTDKSKAIRRLATRGNEKSELIEKYLKKIGELDRSRFSYFNLTEIILNLGRRVFGENVDAFAETNTKAHEFGVNISKSIAVELNEKNWLIILAAANGIELYSFKPKYLERIENLKSLIRNQLRDGILELDASDLFEQKIMSKPIKIAYFTDNCGEADIDLKYILKLSKYYEEITHNGDWCIGIIPKAVPTLTDATYNSIMQSINEDNSPVVELKKFIQTGNVKVFKGGPRGQGANLHNLSQEIVNYLLEVQATKGAVIAKGEANVFTLMGLKIDSFFIFQAKSKEISLAAGIPINSLAVAYVPAGIKGIEGLISGIRQNLSDVLETVQGNMFASISFDDVKQRMARTAEPFIDAVEKLNSSEPVFRGERVANYILPIIKNPNIKGYQPIFIARAAMPFKVAWDTMAKVKKNIPLSYPFMPKIGVIPRYSLGDMITQMLSKEEIEETIDDKTFQRFEAIFKQFPNEIKSEIETELGYPFSHLKGKTRGEIILTLSNPGIDQRCYQALEIFEQLEAEKYKRPQDRNPSLRSNIKRLHASMKGNTQHTVRPLLNFLLAETEFGKFVKRNKVLFIDEAGSTGSTVVSAEFIIRAFNDKAVWKFYTVQPTKATFVIYDGDSGIAFKPEENNPKFYNVFYILDNNKRINKRMGMCFTYEEAKSILSDQLHLGTSYIEKIKDYNSRVGEFLKNYDDEIFRDINRLNSQHAREILKLIIRRKQLESESDNLILRLINAIAEIVVREENIPNHTKYRYTIKKELELIEERIKRLLNTASPEIYDSLSTLDKQINVYDTMQTLTRWEKNFSKYIEDVIQGAEKLAIKP